MLKIVMLVSVLSVLAAADRPFASVPFVAVSNDEVPPADGSSGVVKRTAANEPKDGTTMKPEDTTSKGAARLAPALVIVGAATVFIGSWMIR